MRSELHNPTQQTAHAVYTPMLKIRLGSSKKTDAQEQYPSSSSTSSSSSGPWPSAEQEQKRKQAKSPRGLIPTRTDYKTKSTETSDATPRSGATTNTIYDKRSEREAGRHVYDTEREKGERQRQRQRLSGEVKDKEA